MTAETTPATTPATTRKADPQAGAVPGGETAGPQGPNLMSPELIADPYTGWGRLRERAPVLRGQALDGSPAWYVTRQDDVRALLTDPRFVNDVTSISGVTVDSVRRNVLEQFGVPDELAQYFTGSILNYDGADHLRLRKLVSRAFTVRRVASLRPRVEEIAAGLLDGIAERAVAERDGAAVGGTVDLVESFAYPLPIAVICELVGVPEADRPSWRKSGSALLTMDPATLAPAMQAMVDDSRDLIARRRAEPSDDLLSGLIQAQEDDGDRLSENELITMVFTLVMAGHETTAHLLSNGTLALLTHPDQLELLQSDPARWPACGPRADALVRPGSGHPAPVRRRGRRGRRGHDPHGRAGAGRAGVGQPRPAGVLRPRAAGRDPAADRAG